MCCGLWHIPQLISRLKGNTLVYCEEQGHSMVPIVGFLWEKKIETPYMTFCKWYLHAWCLQQSSKTYSKYIKKLSKEKENWNHQDCLE